MKKSLRKLPALLALVLALMSLPAVASAEQTSAPKGTMLTKDGKLVPAPGYTWVTLKEGDFRVRWVSGVKHPTQANVLSGLKENSWRPAPGYKWANNTPGDLRVVKSGPTDEEIGRGVLKALGALALHKASIPQRDDGFGKSLAREVARAARDELIDSSLKDLFPDTRAVERASIRNLAILALDGRLTHDRDRVLTHLRKVNRDMADAVQVTEFLIRLAKAVDNE